MKAIYEPGASGSEEEGVPVHSQLARSRCLLSEDIGDGLQAIQSETPAMNGQNVKQTD
jgi:hypothetical protein